MQAEIFRLVGVNMDNPPLQETCGLDIVLLLDMSGSIVTAGEVGTVKNAAKAFVDAFQPGTPTLIGIVEFSSGTATIPEGLSSDFTSLKNKIDLLSAGGGTNWEEALLLGTSLLETPPANPDYEDRDDSKHPDLMIIFTDGDPVNSSAGPPVSTQPNIHLAPAVAAADAAKGSDAPIRIVAVGVGAASESRLVAITGPNVASGSNITTETDVILGGFSDLDDILSALAFALCSDTMPCRAIVNANGALMAGASLKSVVETRENMDNGTGRWCHSEHRLAPGRVHDFGINDRDHVNQSVERIKRGTHLPKTLPGGSFQS